MSEARSDKLESETNERLAGSITAIATAIASMSVRPMLCGLVIDVCVGLAVVSHGVSVTSPFFNR